MKKVIREIVNSKDISKRAYLDHVIKMLTQMRDSAGKMDYSDIEVVFDRRDLGLVAIVLGVRWETDEEERERENREREQDIQQYEELKKKLGF